MAFFQNDPSSLAGSPAPSHEEGQQIAPDISHSPKSAPLFKQEGNPVGSLSDYLAKHFNAASTSDAPSAGPASLSSLPSGSGALRANFLSPLPVRPKKPVSEYATDGQFLNSLDVDLPAGLEQYLPTLIFRLRVMKKRLDGEISELRAVLNKYNRLPDPSPDMRDRILAVQHRLRVLENQESRISWQLADALPMGNLFFRVAQGGSQLQGILGAFWGGLWRSVAMVFYGRAYQSVEKAGQELMELESIYRQRFLDKTTPSVELGQLINRYEHTLTVAEKKAAELSGGSFWGRLWQEARGLVK